MAVHKPMGDVTDATSNIYLFYGCRKGSSRCDSLSSTQACRQHDLGYSKVFVWKQRQRPGCRLRIRRTTTRETQKDTTEPSAPQKLLQRQRVKQKQPQRGKQSDESSEDFEKDDSSLSFAERTPAYQSGVRHEAEERVIFSFVLPRNCAGNHMAHKSCGRFFIFTAAICFQEGDHLFFKGPLEKEL